NDVAGTLASRNAETAQRRQRLIQFAASQSGLVVCVDCCNRKASGDFFESMNAFLRDVARERRDKTEEGQRGNREMLPFQRVAIMLAQADRLVERQGTNAATALARLDPARHVRQLIGDIALSDLFLRLLPEARSQVYCGWSSVYGFIPEDGAVNFISTTTGGG